MSLQLSSNRVPGTVCRFIVTMSVSALAFAAGAATAPEFEPPSTFNPGTGAKVLGDFTKDGKTDVATVRNGSMSLLVGTGGGAFAAPISCVLTTSFYSAVFSAADFNNDGCLDLVAPGSYNTHLIFGDGKGNFVLSTNLGYSYAYYPAGVVAGDFNGDGNADIAIADTGNPSLKGVSVAFGRGDGSFSGLTNYALASTPGSIRSADLDGNGALDLVVSLQSYTSAQSNAVAVLLNNGTGRFNQVQFYAGVKTPEYRDDIEAADLNGDQTTDVAVINNSGSVTVWTNTGNGTLVFASHAVLSFQPTSTTTADFNGDGNMDVVVHGSSAMSMLLGNMDGRFTVVPLPRTDVVDTSPHKDLAAADLDLDGRPDLTFASQSGQILSVMLNRTAPTLQLRMLEGHHEVSWLSAFGTGFVLETSTDAGLAANWEQFPQPAVAVGNRKVVADWTAGDRKFYRLKR